LGVKEFVLVGVATEFCDKNTALDGLKAGFEVTVVSDAVKPVVPADGVKAIGEMRAAGVKFLTAVEAEQRLADAV
jgi:nicotinamidase/pyrazinamidase